MHIAELTLRDFRNYAERHFEFAPGGLVIAGPNGAGKTNLLEGVGFLSGGRSVRNLKDTALIRFEQPAFRVEGICRINGKDIRISAGYDRREGKAVRVDGVPVKALSELYQLLRTVYFSPDDVELVSGGPAHRRRFLNLAAAQCLPRYMPCYRTFAQTLKQRNALLEADAPRSGKSAWDERHLTGAEEILRLRMDYLERFIPLFREKYAGIAGREEPGLTYLIAGANGAETSYREIAGLVAAKETRYRRTLFGPQLDELAVTLDDRPARLYASQGQRRSLALALRLAQSEMVRLTQQDPPVLMFDDALAELDAGRVARLRGILPEGGQILIATPNPEAYGGFGLPVMRLG
jgi:DNA replication and repair protein RecF